MTVERFRNRDADHPGTGLACHSEGYGTDRRATRRPHGSVLGLSHPRLLGEAPIAANPELVKVLTDGTAASFQSPTGDR